MENVYEIIETSSDETDNSSEEEMEENEDLRELNNNFLNNTDKLTYLKHRNSLFTKDIEKRIIVVDSHNLHKTDDFNTSNYVFKFTNDSDNNVGIFNNVIGFRLLKGSIRSPAYNVNVTNNKIYYRVVNDQTIHEITINPGSYTLRQLQDVFSNTTITESLFVSYSDTNNEHFNSDSNASNNVQYCTSNCTTSGGTGISFKFFHANGFTILWNYNQIARGAAKLFGFIQREHTSTQNNIGGHFIQSSKTPDISLHYVDLVIPEIPEIACKHNSYGKDIIERITLNRSSGDYVHFVNDDNLNNYFFPIKLHQLTIQLYSENKEFYFSNNAENFFEFEITKVNNLELLN